MATLDSAGVEIHYEVHGSGPAILLTHGYSATAQMWRDQVAPLSRRHTLILWDMRGHGRSAYPEAPDAYSEAATVRDMATILDRCGVERAVIGGLSLGGYMSLAFHLAHPGRTRALMLFDTGPGFKKDEARAAWNETAERMARGFEERGLAADSASLEHIAASHRSAEGLVRAARGMLKQRDARVINSLPHIAVPTLVLVGAEDKPYLAGTDYMASRIPRATKAVIAGAGHVANIDQPAAFNAAVLAFLERLDPA